MLIPPLGPNAAFYASVVNAILQLQQPQQPQEVFYIASTSLPPAASWPNCVVRCSDLNILAVSDGTSWIRQDTGAAI